MALHTRILLGFTLGDAVGVAVNFCADGSDAVCRLVPVSTGSSTGAGPCSTSAAIW